MRKRLRLAALPLPVALGVLAAVLPGTAPAESPAPAPIFKPSISDVVFDGVKVGATSTQRFTTIKNVGNANLLINKVELRGLQSADFSLTADTCTGKTVAPKGSCVLGFVFKPTTAGTRVGHVRISDNTACVNWLTLAGGATGSAAPAPTATAATCESGDTTTTAPAPTQHTTTTTPAPGSDASTRTNTGTVGVQAVTATGAPAGECRSLSKVRIAFRSPKGTKFKAVKVKVGKRSFKVKSAKRSYHADVTFKGLQPGRYKVKILGTLTSGEGYFKNRYFATCVAAATPKA
jgi:hypothetical protein